MMKRFDPERLQSPIPEKKAPGCDGHDIRFEAIKLIAEPGKLERAAVVCCAVCEEVLELHHGQAEQAMNYIQARGWKKIDGRWRCPCCSKQ